MGNFGDEILCEACRKSAGEDKIFTTKKAADFGGFSHGHGTGKLFAAQIFQTAHADIFPLEGCNVPGIPTKNAGGLVLIQDDRRPVHINLQGVALRDVQGAAQLDRQYDTSQFIDLTNDSGCFHLLYPPCACAKNFLRPLHHLHYNISYNFVNQKIGEKA